MLDSKLFDHTILKADATSAQIDEICSQAIKYDFASVCCNSYYTARVKRNLEGSMVKTCTVIGFPLGQMSTKAKVAETEIAVQDGAEEIDMVINVGALKEGSNEVVFEDIKAIKIACGNALLKVIIETCLLSDEEKITACILAKKAGADFVKTSTGFSTGGATAEDVSLMRNAVGPNMGVKASGGIHTKAEAEQMVKAGATRLGTSATIAIIS